MATKTRIELKAFFEKDDKPTETQFGDLMDSIPNLVDDGLSWDKDLSITAYAGGGQANAYELSCRANRIQVCASDHDSVKLPACTAGYIFNVYNINGFTKILDIYPPSGGIILGVGLVDTPQELADNTAAIFVCVDNYTFYSF